VSAFVPVSFVVGDESPVGGVVVVPESAAAPGGDDGDPLLQAAMARGRKKKG
jgi:hypothetical protein